MPSQAVTLRRNQTANAESDKDRIARGQALYVDQCAGCHMEDGSGQRNAFPPLAGNAVVQAREPGTMLHRIIDGARGVATAHDPTGLAMPGTEPKVSINFGCT